ncbi:hypothetical protein GCM10023322_29760 [Rugosimonospora acidiphila]|uniref:Uncharacterized protein n=1 Tax=Rugosimonospora acidiphila TaxID=556531 RepID=A0ABP9RTA5_9ACTN
MELETLRRSDTLHADHPATGHVDRPAQRGGQRAYRADGVPGGNAGIEPEGAMRDHHVRAVPERCQCPIEAAFADVAPGMLNI